MLKPLGDRVLIRPDIAPTMTPSGLHLAEHAKPEQMGTVIAVGHMRHPRKDEAEELAVALYAESLGTGRELPALASSLLNDLVRREPLVSVGDTVIFSWAGGQELRIEDDGERYLIMREEDILAIVESEIA